MCNILSFAKLCMENSTSLPLLQVLSTEMAKKNLGLLHLDCPDLNISDPDELELMVGLAD